MDEQKKYTVDSKGNNLVVTVDNGEMRHFLLDVATGAYANEASKIAAMFLLNGMRPQQIGFKDTQEFTDKLAERFTRFEIAHISAKEFETMYHTFNIAAQRVAGRYTPLQLELSLPTVRLCADTGEVLPTLYYVAMSRDAVQLMQDDMATAGLDVVPTSKAGRNFLDMGQIRPDHLQAFVNLAHQPNNHINGGRSNVAVLFS